MRRTLLLCLGLVSLTWLQFEFFPGHTYLEGGTQIYLPMLERLDAPGYLSRDLVATNPNVTYTVYDEVTLFLHEAARIDFKSALIGQQALFRAAAILGVFLFALAAGLRDLLAFLVAAFVNLGAMLRGPDVFLVGPEAVPPAFAFGLVLLALGLLAREKPLLAGLAGGIAFVYHPVTTAPFWLAVLLIFFFDRQLRSMMRPCLTILFVFVLLLANLAQLQPGIGASTAVLGRISPAWAELQQFRTPEAWVSLWAPHEIWHYLAIWVCSFWALARIWPVLNRISRWFFFLLPMLGILSIPLSWLLLERLRWSLVPPWQPTRALLYTVVMASVACGVAGVRASLAQRKWEGLAWFVVVCAIPINTRVFDLAPVKLNPNLPQFLTCLLLAAALVWLVKRFGATHRCTAVLCAPCLAILILPAVRTPGFSSERENRAILEVADWAKKDTWGSSMFLFPDADRALYPGIFRAVSQRALWVDWESGCEVKYSEPVAHEWWERWRHTMQTGLSTEQALDATLSLPVDYYVLRSAHSLTGARPVFGNGSFVVYDASTLRNVASSAKSFRSEATRP